MIGKVSKRLLDGLFLPLEQQGHGGTQQKERREGSPFPAIDELMQPPAGTRVGNLIVVFQEADESGGQVPARISATRLFLPGVPLPLIQQIPSRHRREL